MMTAEGMSDAQAAQEETALRDLMGRLRAAWKSGDANAMDEGLAPGVTAAPSFSFLQNRIQGLAGRQAVREKMARLNPEAVARTLGGEVGAGVAQLNIEGEAKSIRFLSPTLAIVDGTIQLSGIPRAHGFAPTELRGVYTDYWRKSGNRWRIEATRPWF